MINSKKTQIWKLLGIALAILVFIVIVTIITGIFGRLGTSSKQATGNVDDYDKDGIINIVDKCPCHKESGNIKNDGCPLDYKIKGDNKGIEDRGCLSKLT